MTSKTNPAPKPTPTATQKGLSPAQRRDALLKLVDEIVRHKSGDLTFDQFAGPELVKRTSETIAACKPKVAAGRSPEERAAARAKRDFAKRIDKQVAWLKLDGVRAGGFAVERGTDKVVAVVTDPRIDASGERVVMDVKSGKDGTTSCVDAMLYRPYFDKVHELKQQADTKATEAHIASRSTKAGRVRRKPDAAPKK